jgi:hypothetical protein
MITDTLFLSFLNCPRKAFLQAAGCPGAQPDIERVQLGLDASYRHRALERSLGARQSSEVVVGPTSWADVRGTPKVIVSVTVGDGDLQATLHAAEQVRGGGRNAAAATAASCSPAWRFSTVSIRGRESERSKARTRPMVPRKSLARRLRTLEHRVGGLLLTAERYSSWSAG